MYVTDEAEVLNVTITNGTGTANYNTTMAGWEDWGDYPELYLVNGSTTYKFTSWMGETIYEDLSQSGDSTHTYYSNPSGYTLKASRGSTLITFTVGEGIDPTAPTIDSVTATGNSARLGYCREEDGWIVAYYWGTSSSPSASAYTSITPSPYINTKSVTVTSSGTYYYKVKNAAGLVTSASITITGISPTISVKINNSWKSGTPYVKVNGAWKQAIAVYVKVNGTWKQSV